MSGDPHEQRIVHGLRQGCADSWRALYDAHAQPIWRLVARLMGGSQSEVADVVQETFLAAAGSADTYDPERGSIAAWLTGIARRQVALHYRTQRQRLRLEAATQWLAECNGQLSGWLAGREALPTEVLLASELRLLVRVTLAQLPSDYGVILTAKYLDGATLDDLAAAEGSTTTAVSSKLARARRAFRQAFGKSRAAPDSHGVHHEEDCYEEDSR